MAHEDSTRDGDEFLSSGAQILAALRQRHAATDRLRTLATLEPLTGLANRRLLAAQLPAAVARARRNPHPTALLLVDLDDFKLVNDTFGHATGDAVLQHVAERLRHAVRSFDLVARMGGDEFLIVAESVDAEELRSLSDRVEQLVSTPMDIGGRRLVVHATVADVLSKGDEDGEQLLQRADELLYQRKAERRAEPGGGGSAQ